MSNFELPACIANIGISWRANGTTTCRSGPPSRRSAAARWFLPNMQPALLTNFQTVVTAAPMPRAASSAVKARIVRSVSGPAARAAVDDFQDRWTMPAVVPG